MRGSDPVAMVTDDIDSRIGHFIPKTGERLRLFIAYFSSCRRHPYMLCCPRLWPSILFFLMYHAR